MKFFLHIPFTQPEKPAKDNSEIKRKAKTPKNKIRILNDQSYLKTPKADYTPEYDQISGNQILNGKYLSCLFVLFWIT